jgi:hypothetical protein
MEGLMPSASQWNNAVPRVDLDHRARESRLRLEEAERLLVSRLVIKRSWFSRGLLRLRLGMAAKRSRGSQICGPLSDRPRAAIGRVWPDCGIRAVPVCGISLQRR